MLDPGEREAIQLAEEIGADLLLMDERVGVRIARGRGMFGYWDTGSSYFSGAEESSGYRPGDHSLGSYRLSLQAGAIRIS